MKEKESKAMTMKKAGNNVVDLGVEKLKRRIEGRKKLRKIVRSILKGDNLPKDVREEFEKMEQRFKEDEKQWAIVAQALQKRTQQ